MGQVCSYSSYSLRLVWLQLLIEEIWFEWIIMKRKKEWWYMGKRKIEKIFLSEKQIGGKHFQVTYLTSNFYLEHI